MNEPFHQIRGQSKLKAKLTFGLEAFKNGGIFPHYLFVGARGNGKSIFAKAFAKEVHKIDKSFSAHLINCATLKNVDSFMKQIYEPMINGKNCLLLMDESHNLPDAIQQLFLTALEVEDTVERSIPTDFGEMKINLRRHIFVFISSEPDRLFNPFKDRLEVMALSPYKQAELGEILIHSCPNINFEEGAVTKICETLRGYPRDAKKAADGIKKYCLIKRSNDFSEKDWHLYCQMNDVKPYGLNAGEIQVMKVLAQNGACTLNDLRGATQISRTAIMNDLEPYLLSKHFIKIDGKRHITAKGREAWKYVEQFID